MLTPVSLIWDYDAAIGQINASYPYHFREETLRTEVENVEEILRLGDRYGIRMTFAITGFAAEDGQFPYHVPYQIRAIAEAGHEIASHSWRHEWFPFLEEEQIRRSLARSKYALERCIGKAGAVRGFVPPFSRPMSWYGRLALSLGDRAIGPWYPGASLGRLLGLVKDAGYSWCRIVYRPLIRKLAGKDPLPRRVDWYDSVACIPQHTCGFGEKALFLLEKHLAEQRELVIIGHPLALSMGGEQSMDKLIALLERLASLQRENLVKCCTVQEMLEASGGARL